MIVSYATAESCLLFALEHWLALFKKGLHPFLAVFRGKERVKGFSFEVQSVVEARIRRLEHRFLGVADREQRFSSDLFRHALRFLEQKLHRHDVSDESPAFRLVRVNWLSGEYHLHGAVFANDMG